jgi:hypothetical protein
METDRIPEDVRQYLREHFTEVNDELPEKDYYVFSMRVQSGERRQLKVHRGMFVFAHTIPAFLREHDFAARLEQGNQEIAKPLLS